MRRLLLVPLFLITVAVTCTPVEDTPAPTEVSPTPTIETYTTVPPSATPTKYTIENMSGCVVESVSEEPIFIRSCTSNTDYNHPLTSCTPTTTDPLIPGIIRGRDGQFYLPYKNSIPITGVLIDANGNKWGIIRSTQLVAVEVDGVYSTVVCH